jgi:16S rRNA (cytosine1402-N4)-methyltransferase
LGVERVDGVLLDLGVSSPQIDDATRGFSFRFDGPLDMRMDTASGQTATEWINGTTEQQLYEVIRDYGEERFAKQVARTIVAARQDGPITTTGQLSQVVAKAVKTREPGQDPATRTFQAIRIFLNQELEELSLVLPQCVEALAPGGRLAVISFHSLEDRVVKRFIRDLEKPDTLPSKLPVRARDLPSPRLVAVGKARRASYQEVSANPRSRSAVLRVAERTEAP